MTATTKTYTSPIDLYRHGVAVLTDHLGPVDSVRFLRLLDVHAGCGFADCSQGVQHFGIALILLRDPHAPTPPGWRCSDSTGRAVAA